MDNVSILRIRTPPPDIDMKLMDGEDTILCMHTGKIENIEIVDKNIIYRRELSENNKLWRIFALLVIGTGTITVWTCLYSQSC